MDRLEGGFDTMQLNSQPQFGHDTHQEELMNDRRDYQGGNNPPLNKLRPQSSTTPQSRSFGNGVSTLSDAAGSRPFTRRGLSAGSKRPEQEEGLSGGEYESRVVNVHGNNFVGNGQAHSSSIDELV
jgi:hypothetical protein